VEEALVGVAADDRAAIDAAARLATADAEPLPQTGHKAPLLQTLVADVVVSAAAGETSSESALGERGLPTSTGHR